MRKARRSLRGDVFELNALRKYGKNSILTHEDARNLSREVYKDSFVDLIITSPPFLAQVDYLGDNWLEFWFLDINPNSFKKNLVMTNSMEVWKDFIRDSLDEMFRVLKDKGVVVIEVGDVKYKRQRVNLDEIVEELGIEVGYSVIKRYIHLQKFTKLSNCFNVRNNVDGVNTQRMVTFKKE
ncbi:MAG: DNA methyltransferase [Candidatus Hodarchaeota archaeon]